MKLIEILTSVPGMIALAFAGGAFTFSTIAWITGKHFRETSRIALPARSRDRPMRW